jgi:cytoskeletal protein RodZ
MEPAEAIESPGKYLKTRRESQKLSLEQVAHATRIREAILKALEEDKYEDLPHLYVKSFLSAYAGCLGLDPNEVILLHQKYVKNLPPSKGKVLRHQPIPRKRRVNVRLLVILISALLLAALVVFASFKLLPRVFPSLRTEVSSPFSSSSAPFSAPVQKEI